MIQSTLNQKRKLMAIADQQLDTGSQNLGFFNQINKRSELVSLGLGASVIGISAYNGGRIWESVAIGSIPAVGLYSGLKIFNLFKKTSSQDFLEDSSNTSIEARNSSKYKVGPLGASCLSLTAGLAFAGLAQLSKNNFCKYASLVCIVPSLGFMAYEAQKNLFFKAQPTKEGPIFTTEKDPRGKYRLSIDPVERKNVRTPKVRKEGDKWVITREEIERYNLEMGYVFDIKNIEDYKQFIKDYSTFPFTPVEKVVFSNSQSGGKATLERQHSTVFTPFSASEVSGVPFSVEKAASISSQSGGKAASERPPSSDVSGVPFSVDQAGKFMDLLRFGTTHLPLFLEKLEFDTEDEFNIFYVEAVGKRETIVKEMGNRFRNWCKN